MLALKKERILLTGGNGRLGSALQKLIPDIFAPKRSEMDLAKPNTVHQTFALYKPTLVIHAAAYTNVAQAELEQAVCWQTNVEGTRTIVQAANVCGAKLIHISTDYVFWGDKGDYKEDDSLGPVRNYYALTKLVAEELVRLHGDHLVVRTSFRPNAWPYPVAFEDLYTSQDYLDVIAPEIALLVQNHEQCWYHTLHIATERKSVFDLAKRRSLSVQQGSKQNAKVSLPDDISLNVDRWQLLKKQWVENQLHKRAV